jgi:hypothetical protein
MTINKSQGQSLKMWGFTCLSKYFCHGQLYVALSRVTNKNGLKVLTCEDEGLGSNMTKKIVYKEIF